MQQATLAGLFLLVPASAGASSVTLIDMKAKADPTVPKEPPPTATAAPSSQQPSAFAPPAKDEARYSLGRTFDSGFPVMATLGFSSNDLQVGLGVRAGKTLTNHIYVGGAFVYHLGHDVASAQVPGYSVSASISAFYVGPEIGYDFDLAPVRIRAYAGLGIVWINTSTTSSGPALPAGVSASATTDRFVIWPGATLLYPLPNSSFFIGGDLRFVTIPGGPAVGLFALAGTSF